MVIQYQTTILSDLFGLLICQHTFNMLCHGLNNTVLLEFELLWLGLGA